MTPIFVLFNPLCYPSLLLINFFNRGNELNSENQTKRVEQVFFYIITVKLRMKQGVRSVFLGNDFIPSILTLKRKLRETIKEKCVFVEMVFRWVFHVFPNQLNQYIFFTLPVLKLLEKTITDCFLCGFINNSKKKFLYRFWATTLYMVWSSFKCQYFTIR